MKKTFTKSVFALIATLTLFVLTANISTAQNLVQNPGFEQDTTGLGFGANYYPALGTASVSLPKKAYPKWSITQSKNRNNVEWLTSTDNVGGTGRAAKLVTSAAVVNTTNALAVFDIKLVSDPMATERGSVYDVKVRTKMVRSDAVTSTNTAARIVINPNGAAGTENFFGSPTTTTTGWTTFTASYTSPTTADRISIETGSFFGDLLVDEVEVVKSKTQLIKNPQFRIGPAISTEFWTLDPGSNGSTLAAQTVGTAGSNVLNGGNSNNGALRALIKPADAGTETNVSVKTTAFSTPINSTNSVSFWVKTEDPSNTASTAPSGKIGVEKVLVGSTTARGNKVQDAVTNTDVNTGTNWTLATYTFVATTPTTELKFDLAGPNTSVGGGDIVYLLDGLFLNQQLAAPQPVTLNKFSAKAASKGVNVEWSTSSETNFSHFEVQKSLNGKEFNTLNKVIANNKGIYYSFDNNAKNGLNYYRLKMVDLDGSFEYSKIAAINYNDNLAYYEFENPVLGNEIQLRSNVEAPIFTLYSGMGRKVQTTVTNQNNGLTTIKPVQAIQGLYFLNVTGKSSNKTLKVIFK